MKCEAMREKPINKGLQQFHRSVARIWELLRRVHFELLIIGSQVRALVRPPRKIPYFPMPSWGDAQEQNGSHATLFVVARCATNDDVLRMPLMEPGYARDLISKDRREYRRQREAEPRVAECLCPGEKLELMRRLGITPTAPLRSAARR